MGSATEKGELSVTAGTHPVVAFERDGQFFVYVCVGKSAFEASTVSLRSRGSR